MTRIRGVVQQADFDWSEWVTWQWDEVLNPSSPRAANSVLYDAATAQLVAERDGALLAFFGYNATDAAQADRWRATLAAAMARRAVRTLQVPPAYRST